MAGCAAVQQAIGSVPRAGPYAHRLVAMIALAGRRSVVVDQAFSLRMVNREDWSLARRAIADMRTIVTKSLPGYMIPTIWIVVEELPRLTSGKTNRKAVTEWLQNLSDEDCETVTRVAQAKPEEEVSTPSSRLQSKLQSIWSRVLNIPTQRVGMDRPFLSLGGDSITAMQVATRCRQENIVVTVGDILKCRTIASLSQVASEVNPYSVNTNYSEALEAVNTPFPLSPMQQMFFELEPNGCQHFNQSFFVSVSRDVDSKEMAVALQEVVSFHPMFRARFFKRQGEWQQVITDDLDGSLDFATLTVDSVESAEAAAEAVQGHLDIGKGPVMAARLINTESCKQFLFLTAHHLIIDLVSWRIVLANIEEHLAGGRQYLSPRPYPFSAWTQAVSEYGRQQCSVDNTQLAPTDFAYWQINPTDNIWGDVMDTEVFLDPQSSKGLLSEKIHEALSTEIVDVLLAAISHAFRCTFGNRAPPTVFNEGHGREQIHDDRYLDLSNTVGWFTSIYPVSVEASQTANLVEIVRRTKDARHRLTNNGLSYMAYRYGTSEGRQAKGSVVEILFNYVGQYQQLARSDSLLKYHAGGAKESFSPKAKRFALLEMTAGFEDGCFKLNILHSRRMAHQKKLAAFPNACMVSIKDAIHRLSDLDSQYTLADFPMLPLSYSELRQLVAERLSPLSDIEAELKKMIEDIYPSTPMQQGMLLRQKSNEYLYQVNEVWEARTTDGTAVNPVRLQRAWQKVVDRHAILRTVIVDGVSTRNPFLQIVLKKVSASSSVQGISTVDEVRDLPPMIHNEGSLMQPQVHLTIASLLTGRVCLRLEINHALTDGFSTAILRRDLCSSYEERELAFARPLYSSFVKQVEKESSQTSLEFWKTQLAGVEICRFPQLHDEKPVAGQKLLTEHVDLFLTSEELRQFCQTSEITISNLFQIAWALLLRTYTASDVVTYGVMVSGRDGPLKNIEEIAGPTISMLPYHLTIPGAMTIRDLFRKSQDIFLNLLSHRSCSLAEIYHTLDLSGEHLFNTAMSVQTSRSLTEDFSRLKIDDLGAYDPTEFDLFLNVFDGADSGVNVSFNFWQHNMSVTMAKSVAATLDCIITALIRGKKSDDVLSMNLTSTHDANIIRAWNSYTPHGNETTVHATVAQRAIERPLDPAIESWDGCLNFRELNESASAFAQHLRKLGLGSNGNSMVPFAMSKSALVPVIMLGILKAGGACVALDPSHPPARLSKIIEDARAELLVTTPEHEQKFKNLPQAAAPLRVVLVHPAMISALVSISTEDIDIYQPQSPAFVVFTSGKWS
jgi:non-ribosomal peptide synthase protein (TIGR01720 family)